MAPNRSPHRLLWLFLISSLLVHAGILRTMVSIGPMEFAPPPRITTDVRLVLPPPEVPPATATVPLPATAAGTGHPAQTAATLLPQAPEPTAVTNEATTDPMPAPEESPNPTEPSPGAGADEAETVVAPSSAPPASSPLRDPPARIKSSGEFLPVRREKLTYQISLYGLTVGTAVLEAEATANELRISSTIRSGDAVALFYPVDNTIVTRLFSGRYLVTTIRQREGSVRKDVGFTLSYPERTIFWTDRLKKTYSTEPMPDEETLDPLAGLYALRRAPLEVGETRLVPLYDSMAYAPTAVDVLRRERLELADGRERPTVVIRPHLRPDTFIRHRGDLLLWLTDDDSRVPVRIETQVPPLGTVIAELVSSEVERYPASPPPRQTEAYTSR